MRRSRFCSEVDLKICLKYMYLFVEHQVYFPKLYLIDLFCIIFIIQIESFPSEDVYSFSLLSVNFNAIENHKLEIIIIQSILNEKRETISIIVSGFGKSSTTVMISMGHRATVKANFFSQ